MTEESLTSEDKEILRTRLELLQREYEKTAQRLQRAERREAVRRHVKDRISDQNRLLQISTTSSVSNPGLRSEESLKLETMHSDGFPSTKKVPIVRFHLCDETHTSQSPTHRLRTKRSRLRLQSREKGSDTDSQEKVSDRVEGRLGEENVQKRVDEKNQNEWKEKRMSEGEVNEHKERKETKDKMSESGDNSDVGLRKNIHLTPYSLADNSSALEIISTSQLKVNISPAGQSMDNDSQSSSAAFDQLFMQMQTKDQNEGAASGVENGCEGKMTVPFVSETAGFLNSCTLVEGLPFPVEYYIRTTRRMAAAHSPVDLDAVIFSQLSGGRGRRRSRKFQRKAGTHSTSEPSRLSGRITDQPRHSGHRKRGRKRTQDDKLTSMKSSPVDSCIKGCSEEREFIPESAILPSQPLPPAESVSQAEQVPTSEHASNTQPLAADLKDPSDSQLYLNYKLLPDSEAYPIFRKRQSKAGGAMLYSQAETSVNGCTPPLPSIFSLAQALRKKFQFLKSFDIQDFHLPDDEFGQLKLERLRMSCLNVELTHRALYNTQQTSKHLSFKAWERKDSPEAQCLKGELLIPEPLPISSSLEGSVPLNQINSAQQSERIWNASQSGKYTESAVQLGVTTTAQDPGPFGNGPLLYEPSTDKHYPQISMAGLTTLNVSASEDKNVRNKEDICSGLQEKAGELHTFLQNEQDKCRPHEAHATLDDGNQCPAGLNLSMFLSSCTQNCPNSSLPSLGITPHLLTPSLSFPSDQGAAPCSFRLTEHVAPAEVTSCSSPRANGNVCQVRAQSQAQPETPSGSEPGESTEAASEVCKVIESLLQNICEHAVHGVPSETQDKADMQNQLQGAHQYKNELYSINKHEIPPQEGVNHQVNLSTSLTACSIPVLSSAQGNASDNQKEDGSKLLVSVLAEQTHTATKQVPLGKTSPSHLVAQETDAGFHCLSWPIQASPLFVDVDFCGTFEKINTLKGGSMLDVCLVQWPSEDWCICVAGEWSVCVWAQKAGFKEWNLLHTWNFTASVISLQGIPDSHGLVSVSLGRLEITELRVLCCPSIDGEFAQTELCKDALQAVVAVSECRLVCCSAPGGQQKIRVFTLTLHGRISDSLSLVPSDQSVQALAAVERNKDALIGWTECKTLLIWNMKSGHLLQTIQLAETVSRANFLKGYSYKGVLCVLLQNGSACEEKNGSALFTLIAINPVTCKYTTLTSISSPAPDTERLIDGDVCESMLVGVFQSGHLITWDLRRGIRSVFGGDEMELCHLARWAGPNYLITGYLNGDVHLYQYKPADIKEYLYP